MRVRQIKREKENLQSTEEWRNNGRKFEEGGLNEEEMKKEKKIGHMTHDCVGADSSQSPGRSSCCVKV